MRESRPDITHSEKEPHIKCFRGCNFELQLLYQFWFGGFTYVKNTVMLLPVPRISAWLSDLVDVLPARCLHSTLQAASHCYTTEGIWESWTHLHAPLHLKGRSDTWNSDFMLLHISEHHGDFSLK